MLKLPAMTLFHATANTRGQHILSDGFISHEASPVVQWLQPTTKGWVYLTDNIDYAVNWGNKVSLLNKCEPLFTIFKIKIPVELCFPDTDNLIIDCDFSSETVSEIDTLQSLMICNCCKINSDLMISHDITAYCHLPTRIHQNRKHSMFSVVDSLVGHISPHEHILYEQKRRMIEWVSL